MKICAACREPWPAECICDEDEPVKDGSDEDE